jgi:hypothetical protein
VIIETIEMLAFPEGFDVSHPALPATGIPPSTVVSFGRTAANAQQQNWGAGSGPAGFPTGGPIPWVPRNNYSMLPGGWDRG